MIVDWSSVGLVFSAPPKLNYSQQIDMMDCVINLSLSLSILLKNRDVKPKLENCKLRKEKFDPNCQFLRFGNDCSLLILSLSLPHEECDHDGDR